MALSKAWCLCHGPCPGLGLYLGPCPWIGPRGLGLYRDLCLSCENIAAKYHYDLIDSVQLDINMKVKKDHVSLSATQHNF